MSLVCQQYIGYISGKYIMCLFGLKYPQHIKNTFFIHIVFNPNYIFNIISLNKFLYEYIFF